MGQEKSLPVRCTSANSTSNSSNQCNYRASLSTTTSTKSLASATSSINSNASSTSTSSSSSSASIASTAITKLPTSRPQSAISSRTSASSYKSADRQSKYLSEHLYIKSYLDIEEEDRNAQKHFRPAPPGGIRNYQPKILTDNKKVAASEKHQEIDVWI